MIALSPLPDRESNVLTLAQFEKLYLDEAIQKVRSESHHPLEEARLFVVNCFTCLKSKFPVREYWEEKELWKEFRKIVHQQLYQRQKRMDKNFGLSEAKFSALLSALKNGDDSLFEKVFLAHFKSCQTYLIKNYNASEEDAYDATMNTFLEFHDRLRSDKVKYGNLRFLFTRMASQVYFKWIKKEKVKESLGELVIQDTPDEIDQESFSILNKAWEKLGDQCQGLLKEFYYQEVSLNHIAERMGKSHAAVRKQKQRCVEKLRALFIKNS